MKRTVWTFGLISGAVLSAMMAMTVPFSHQIGLDRAMVLGYTTMVLAFLLIWFGIRSYRDNVGRGHISFGRALAVGSLIALISSACYTATWEVIYFNFMPNFQAEYATAVIGKMKTSGASQAAIDARAAELKSMGEWYKNPVLNAAVTMLEPLPVGIVIALVSAGVLSRRRKGQTPAALVEAV